MEGRKVKAVCDYILTGRKLKWRNFRVIETDFDSDHKLVKGRLRTNKVKTYWRRLRERKKPKVDVFAEEIGQREVDKELQSLYEVVKAYGSSKGRERKQWISKEAFKLMHKKKSALRRNDGEEFIV